MPAIYPSWRYHASLDAVVVNSAEEDLAIGADWAATPAAFIEQPDDVPPELIAQEADLQQQEATVKAEESALEAQEATLEVSITEAKKAATRKRAKASKD